jgi:hypothetical protein
MSEVLSYRNPQNQGRLLRVLAALSEGRGLLPFPQQLLQRVTDPIKDGYYGSGVHAESLRLKDLTPQGCSEAEKWTNTLKKQFKEMHDTARPKVQAFIRANPEQAPWDSAQAFLDQFWTTARQQDTLLQGFWQDFGHTGQAPIEKMIAHPLWRLFLDLEGVAVFERAIVLAQPPQVHLADLLQLLYLALSPRGILVTTDRSLFRAAAAVLHGRYPQAQVLMWDEFQRCL